MIVGVLAAVSCRQIDVYEKVAEIPGHEWKRNHKAIVEIDVKDSTYHNIFFVIRHTEKFQFTNIVATLTVQDTAKASKPISFMRLNIPIVNKHGNWVGNNMDDLYYHRVKINQSVFFKPGRYKFILQHEMRENPLRYVLNVGAAIEKITTQP